MMPLRYLQTQYIPDSIAINHIDKMVLCILYALDSLLQEKITHIYLNRTPDSQDQKNIC